MVAADPLAPSFYDRATLEVARDLLGKLIVRRLDDGLRIARIVETEAYLPDDPASHSYRGPTPRSRIMFGPPGHAYVYLIYGMHHCLNTVTEAEGRGGAVLIRAAEPLHGLEAMWRARFPETAAPAGITDPGGPAEPRDLAPDPRLAARIASGPGKLCRALDVRHDRENGLPLDDGALVIAREVTDGRIHFAALEDLDLVADERIGISTAAHQPWRFTVSGSRFVSRKPDPAIRPQPHHPR